MKKSVLCLALSAVLSLNFLSAVSASENKATTINAETNYIEYHGIKISKAKLKEVNSREATSLGTVKPQFLPIIIEFIAAVEELVAAEGFAVQVTTHAAERAIEREIGERVLADAILKGKKYYDLAEDSRIAYNTSKNVAAVIARNEGKVITTYEGAVKSRWIASSWKLDKLK